MELEMPEKPKPSNTLHVPRWAPEDYRHRPLEYDPAAAERILEMVLQGETLSAICSYDRDLPLPGTFLRWTEDEEELGQRYLRARKIGDQIRFDEIPEEARRGNGLNVSALRHHTERNSPERYGPRAITPQAVKDPNEPVVDHTAELRRKIDQMADRARARLGPVADRTEAPSGAQ